jgi:hypothetical protein
MNGDLAASMGQPRRIGVESFLLLTLARAVHGFASHTEVIALNSERRNLATANPSFGGPDCRVVCLAPRLKPTYALS